MSLGERVMWSSTCWYATLASSSRSGAVGSTCHGDTTHRHTPAVQLLRLGRRTHHSCVARLPESRRREPSGSTDLEPATSQSIEEAAWTVSLTLNISMWQRA